MEAASRTGAADRLSNLPDQLIHKILSFLPPRDAVRTCVLSSSWRQHWVFADRVNLETADFANKISFERFVNKRMLCYEDRTNMSIHTFWVQSCKSNDFLEPDRTNLWLQSALRKNAQVVGIRYLQSDWLVLDHATFASSSLKELHLIHVNLSDGLLRKLSSSCPALEVLELTCCTFGRAELSCARLKHLMIDASVVNHSIDTFRLLMLRFEGGGRCIPSLGNMPSLSKIHIQVDDWTFSNASDKWNILTVISHVSELGLQSSTGNRSQTVFSQEVSPLKCCSLRYLEIEGWEGDSRISRVVELIRDSAPSLKRVHLKLLRICIK